MGNVLLMGSVSLDGYMEGPGQDLSWHRVDEELHTEFNRVLAGCGVFLDGRVTFEMMAAYWPTADEDPDATAPEREFAAMWREKPKVVFSKTIEEAGWGATVEREVTPELVDRLKATYAGDLAVGGANLAASFMALDLIDEVRLYVHPIVLGAGTRMFGPLERPSELRLVDTHAFPNDVVMLRYLR